MLFVSFALFGQVTASELIQLHSLSNTDMQNLTSVVNGSLAYNSTDDHVYMYDGSVWRKLVIESPKVMTITDDGKAILVDSPNGVNVRVPVGLVKGFNVSLYQIGLGKIFLVGSGTVLKNRLNRFISAGVDAGVGILCTNTNVFHVTGDLRR